MSLTWALARATGLVAWALSSAAVLWGLAVSTRVLGKRPAPAWLLDLHRHLGGLALLATLAHVVSLLLDEHVAFGLVDALVPFASEWRPGTAGGTPASPGAIAAGVVALWLLAAVELTSLLRSRVPLRWWRRVHATSAVVFVMSTWHLLTAGTDASEPWVLAPVLAVCGAATFLLAVRVLAPRRAARRGAARKATPARGRPNGDGSPRRSEGSRRDAEVGSG